MLSYCIGKNIENNSVWEAHTHVLTRIHSQLLQKQATYHITNMMEKNVVNKNYVFKVAKEFEECSKGRIRVKMYIENNEICTKNFIEQGKIKIH